MPTAWLDRSECTRDGGLPDVCLKCGAPATVFKRQNFRWCPPWVLVTILAGVLIWAIIASILTKHMTVYAPMCAQHANHWFKRKLFAWISLLTCLTILIAGIVVMAASDKDKTIEDIGASLAIGGGFGFVIMLFPSLIVINSGIKPSEITDNDIKLKGVSEEFCEALRQQRKVERDEQDRRREERAAARGEDDEEDGRRRRRSRDDDDDEDEDRRPRRRRNWD